MDSSWCSLWSFGTILGYLLCSGFSVPSLNFDARASLPQQGVPLRYNVRGFPGIAAPCIVAQPAKDWAGMAQGI